MKILFLDVDGILSLFGSGGGLYSLNRKRLKLLQEIIEDTGAKIVLSSTWRKDEYAIKRLKRALKYRNLEIYDVTPDFSFQKNGERAYRGHEIESWLNKHEEVTNWVALDDDSDFLDSQLRNLVQADGTIGLTETLAYRAKYILNNGPTNIK